MTLKITPPNRTANRVRCFTIQLYLAYLKFDYWTLILGPNFSASNTDMVSEFVSWRAYLADSLRHGHLPLWNFFTCRGKSFLGVSNSAKIPENKEILRRSP